MDNDALLALLQADGDIVTERLDHWARTRADRVFLHYGEDRITHTYAEFGRISDHIAGNLAAHGIAKGDRVSVLTTNSYIAALLMFGIWKAGAVYCPVNFGFTGRLLAYQLNDTAPSLLVTDARLLPAVNDVVDQLQAPPPLVVYAPPRTPMTTSPTSRNSIHVCALRVPGRTGGDGHRVAQPLAAHRGCRGAR
ncbi:AMP-binding protein [Streptomyces sp. NPDC007264]|uniref:AMP-binding protein n=1 Tax=Streptomyces sp. NPDC007264 TaxID=3364777 RepID=UPI0036DB5959